MNQIPPWVEISGDVRLTPFYEPAKCIATLQAYAADIQANLEKIPTRGPSKFFLTDSVGFFRVAFLHRCLRFAGGEHGRVVWSTAARLRSP